eukprot:5426797-Pleurochrysis_carterae.AAC.1
MIGGARKPSTKQPTSRQFSHYGECVASDLCEMPTSLPFCFRYMLCFYDLATVKTGAPVRRYRYRLWPEAGHDDARASVLERR